MKFWTKLLSVAVLPALLAGCTQDDLEALVGAEMYFVKLNAGPAQVAGLVSTLSGELGFKPIHVYDSTTQGFSVKLIPRLAEELEKLKEVEYVQVDTRRRRTPDEEHGPDDGGLPFVDADEIPESIARIGGPYLHGGLDCHVAVIDTGIDASHPDLYVVGELDAVARSGGTPAPGADPNGHGTHVAGTIGAIGDGEGVVGVAPGIPLHAVRVLDANGSGFTTDIVAGLEYALKQPEICVVNMSLGGYGDPYRASDPMRQAIDALEANGVVVVIAAGNNNDNTASFVPAGYDRGIVVSAYDAAGGRDHGFAVFTNYGDEVDIAAPGVDILSTWPGGGYASISGTSMAAPAVAGAAAVYKSLHPDASPDQVREHIVARGENGYTGQTGANGKHPEPLLDLPAMLTALQ